MIESQIVACLCHASICSITIVLLSPLTGCFWWLRQRSLDVLCKAINVAEYLNWDSVKNSFNTFFSLAPNCACYSSFWLHADLCLQVFYNVASPPIPDESSFWSNYYSVLQSTSSHHCYTLILCFKFNLLIFCSLILWFGIPFFRFHCLGLLFWPGSGRD